MSSSGWLVPNGCQISELCIGQVRNTAAEHMGKPLPPMKHLLSTQGWPTEHSRAHSIMQRSHPERFEWVFVQMQHTLICLHRQEQTLDLLDGACLGRAKLRDSQGAGSVFQGEELSLGVTAMAGKSCTVRAK